KILTHSGFYEVNGNGRKFVTPPSPKFVTTHLNLDSRSLLAHRLVANLTSSFFSRTLLGRLGLSLSLCLRFRFSNLAIDCASWTTERTHVFGLREGLCRLSRSWTGVLGFFNRLDLHVRHQFLG